MKDKSAKKKQIITKKKYDIVHKFIIKNCNRMQSFLLNRHLEPFSVVGTNLLCPLKAPITEITGDIKTITEIIIDTV